MPRIRKASDADVAAITRIYGHYVSHSVATFELTPPLEVEMRARMEALRAKGYPYLVCEVNGELVGYAYASAYRPRPAYRFTVEDSIYLEPGHTGKGYGTMLLKALIGECKGRGFRQMVAIVGGAENTASIRLHEKCGFRIVGVLKEVGYKFERAEDTVILQRAI